MFYLVAVSVGIAIFSIHLARRFNIEQSLFSYSLIAGSCWYLIFGVFEELTLANWIAHLIAASFFLILGILGVTRSMGFAAVGWGIHILWDFSAHLFGEVPGPWWTGPTCLGFDPVISLYIAIRMKGYIPLHPLHVK